MAGLSKARFRTLRSLRLKKRREKEGKFIVEGVRCVREALEGEGAVEAVIVSEDAGEAARGVSARAEKAGVETIVVDDETLVSISSNPTPQGLVAVIRRKAPVWEEWLGAGRDLLFLDGIQDPGNMGTLIRAGRAFGLGGVIVGKGSVDPFHPKVLRAAAGAHFRMGVSDPVEAGACMIGFGRAGLPVVVADPHGGIPFEEAEYPPILVLALGNEGAGVSETVRQAADRVVRIPLMDGTESINVAVASGILLYHISRRRPKD